jgi:hypothetical protein
MTNNNTILYITDNSVRPDLAEKVREILVREAGDIPIVSASQEPMDFGTNVCVGKIGRSWLSLYKGMAAGLEAVGTMFTVIAEHDCLYAADHLRWTPPRADTFYYNANHWFCEWRDRHPEMIGMYSYWPGRYALSQMICSTAMLKQAVAERIHVLSGGYEITRGLPGATEFGVVDQKAVTQIVEIASSGSKRQLKELVGKYLTTWRAERFRTERPNVDIRHGGNFTGPRRGKHRCFEIPYWGRMEDVLGPYSRG